MAEVYTVHDNGGRPFTVTVRPAASAADARRVEITCNDPRYVFGAQNWRLEFVCDEVMAGGADAGSSVLLSLRAEDAQQRRRYVFIGDEVYTFSVDDDRILSYHTPIGNNDVPYPYAIGEQYTYLMIEHVRIPNADLARNALASPPADPYQTYYQLHHLAMYNGEYSEIDVAEWYKSVSGITIATHEELRRVHYGFLIKQRGENPDNFSLLWKVEDLSRSILAACRVYPVRQSTLEYWLSLRADNSDRIILDI